jgi:hypothetical protein
MGVSLTADRIDDAWDVLGLVLLGGENIDQLRRLGEVREPGPDRPAQPWRHLTYR